MRSPDRNLPKPKTPEADPKPFEGVYSVTAPREGNDPIVQFTLGKPSKVESFGVLLPGGNNKEWRSFQFDVPVLIGVGAEQLSAVAKARISSENNGKQFEFVSMHLQDQAGGVSEDVHRAIQTAFIQEIGPQGKELSVHTALIREIELVCRTERDKQFAALEK